jgi:GrpB-like predicted nucleotidyltransferase (UPF0157 family)
MSPDAPGFTSDEDLQKSAVGELRPHNAPIELADYDPRWYRLTIREPEWFEHRLFKGPDMNINLHVFTAGTPEIARMLRFRDWLRADDDDRDYYAAAKRGLAGREWRHVQHYAEAKTAVVQEIMARADAAAR